VDRSSAVRQLPELHAVAIRLRDKGYDDHVIGVALAIDDHQVPTLLRIAASKLANLMARDGTPPLEPTASITHEHDLPDRADHP
jgi:hypothetical protein